jgi:hypothetical protein
MQQSFKHTIPLVTLSLLDQAGDWYSSLLMWRSLRVFLFVFFYLFCSSLGNMQFSCCLSSVRDSD